MGLDIYFYKHKPADGVDKQDICSLERDMDETYNVKLHTFIEQIKPDVEQAKTDEEAKVVLNKIVSWLDSNHGSNYARLYCPHYQEDGLESLHEFYAWLQCNENTYRKSDLYYRKVNWIYAFFQDFLKGEMCIVEKHMVEDIVDRCKSVINEAERCGVILSEVQNGKPEDVSLIDWYKKIAGEHPNGWIDIARDILPTRGGFFFGSTDYDIFYLESVANAQVLFQQLLDDWQDGEICWVSMDW